LQCLNREAYINSFNVFNIEQQHKFGTINIRFAKGNPTCNVSIGRLINSFNVTNVEKIKNLLQYFSSEIFLILTRAGAIS
jgi:hypothetical protein